jgi:peptide/nickel transport system permease protein
MEAASISAADAQLKGPALGGRFGRIVAQALRTWRGKVGLGLTLFVVAVAFLGPLVGGTSPLELKGAPFEAPGHATGPLGGDALGRSVLARVLHGGWHIMLVALAATILAVVVGTAAEAASTR